ncbi:MULTISPECIES: 16S rRNA (guanine(966)-N(2))-methyltransferase RsmD [Giesbergeria]|uniref:16S rRNA (Guanine(966)-N(2))-methyltransferase RsmD n=1 Tax=Giesbergeria sinuosa TaxID=80883 RepID=A0ABV9QHB2_9BURK
MSRRRLTPAQAQAALHAAAPPSVPVASIGKTAPTPQQRTKPAPTGAGEVRIIGGQWRRTRLPVAIKPGLRPTPDRVRETLFNWLGQDLSGWRCLDAFAGTGALGLEAASRGAASVQLIEQDATLVAQLQILCQRLQASTVQLRRGDGVAQLRQCPPASLDLVLLDPPFDSDFFQPALQAAVPALTAQGFIYLEAPTAWNDAALAPLGLVLHRHLRAGAVHAHLLTQRQP